MRKLSQQNFDEASTEEFGKIYGGSYIEAIMGLNCRKKTAPRGANSDLKRIRQICVVKSFDQSQDCIFAYHL